MPRVATLTDLLAVCSGSVVGGGSISAEARECDVVGFERPHFAIKTGALAISANAFPKSDGARASPAR